MYSMPPHRSRNRVLPRKRSVSSVFSFRSFDYKSNRFLKYILVSAVIILTILISVF